MEARTNLLSISIDKQETERSIEYSLYNWEKKCKWAYLCGVYLVDPAYKEEFITVLQVCQKKLIVHCVV
jgi:hypothetical protein